MNAPGSFNKNHSVSNLGRPRRCRRSFQVVAANSNEGDIPAKRPFLGTDSSHFIDASLRRLMVATILPDEAAPSEESLSAALAFVGALRPENEVEAALAIDAACLHAVSRPYWPGSQHSRQ